MHPGAIGAVELVPDAAQQVEDGLGVPLHLDHHDGPVGGEHLAGADLATADQLGALKLPYEISVQRPLSKRNVAMRGAGVFL